MKKYNLIKQIGKGGFSQTFLATDENENQYAIKKINLDLHDIRLLHIVEKEIEFIQKISHPNIPKFYESFKVRENDYLEVNIVQEYIEGQNLYQLIKDGKHFTENEVIKILIQVLKILELLHNSNPSMIHRDIKPSNIMIDNNGKIFLIDFGAIKEKVTFEYTSKSGLSTIIGTQGYMPIEQFEGRINVSSDIYSLGLTAIYLLSGKEPLELPKKGLDIQFDKYVNISSNLSSILNKMINPDYTLRYKSVSQVKRDLYNVSDNKNQSLLVSRNQNKIQKYLEDKEEIVLSEKPKLSYILKSNYVHSLSLVGLFLSITSALSLIFAFYSIKFNSLPLVSIMITFSLVQIFVSMGLLAIPYYAFKYSRNTYYVLTDKRIIFLPTGKKSKPSFFNLPIRIVSSISKSIIVYHDLKNIMIELPTILIRVLEFNNNPHEIQEIVSKFEDIKSIDYSELKSFHIERIEYKDGSGDLIFYFLKDGKKEIYMKLVSISDVKSIEKLIIERISHPLNPQGCLMLR